MNSREAQGRPAGRLSPAAGWLDVRRLRHLMSQLDPGGEGGGATAGAGQPRRPDVDEECRGALTHVIEAQIIPRLLEASRAASQGGVGRQQTDYNPSAAEILDFALLCVRESEEPAFEYVESLVDEGVLIEDMFLKLIGPAAVELGRRWESDQSNFTHVTLGLMRMHQIAHRLGYLFQEGPKDVGLERRIMLASAPGSHHILGLVMVSEFFRKQGWQVVLEITNTEQELFSAVSSEWFDMVGLSVGLVEQIDTLPDFIRRVRAVSRNPVSPVILGGPAFTLRKVAARDVGADGISTDAREALDLADSLVARFGRAS